MSQRPHAILALADGTVFHGVSIGVDGVTAGEVAFNTAMTGYQEILTDPSYCQQIITLTYPHIGNTGTNQEDFESGIIDTNMWSLTGNPTWGVTDYKGFTGRQSAWCAADGDNPANPSNTYLNNMACEMKFGPFDFSDDTYAFLNFYYDADRC